MLLDGFDLIGVDLDTGEELWAQDFPNHLPTNGGFTDGDRLVFVDVDTPAIDLLDLRTGQLSSTAIDPISPFGEATLLQWPVFGSTMVLLTATHLSVIDLDS